MQTMSEEKTASEGHAEGEAGTRSAELVKRARRQHGIEAVRTIIRFAMDRMRETQLQEVAPFARSAHRGRDVGLCALPELRGLAPRA